jgi:transporter family protein
MPRWLFLGITASILFGVWGVLPKATSPQFSPSNMQLLSILGMVPIASVLLLSKNIFIGSSLARGSAYAFVTGVFGNCGNVAMLEALKHGGSASLVYPFTGMFPLVTLIVARVWLKERLNAVQKWGVLASLVAIYLLSTSSVVETVATNPPAVVHHRTGWVFFSLIALMLFGICGVTQKLAVTSISTELASLWWVAGSIPIAAAIAFIQPFRWDVTNRDCLISVLWGVLVVLGMLTSFAAYVGGKASVVTALTALYPALTVILSVFIFHEHLDARKVVAIVLALIAGLALAHEGEHTSIEGAMTIEARP